MSTGQSAAQPQASTVALTRAWLLGMLAIALVVGVTLGAIAVGYVTSVAPRGSVGGAVPQPTFDAPAFRGEERELLLPAPSFNAPAFRDEERKALDE